MLSKSNYKKMNNFTQKITIIDISFDISWKISKNLLYNLWITEFGITK